ncbi:MAG: polyprenyl synthetase family protein [Ferrovibrio sp.]|uniref:polyprenyl synthetase family protein n=1 Tax=Ferrovibrio sp. TaxID=1917215 RepID=UPI00260620CA|nr:farnesyl diphosphate synthase [Ferrovibrio sp.]MCW0235851.1 polyprenyl synthetase family protein [Ferrovibrio sp.]
MNEQPSPALAAAMQEVGAAVEAALDRLLPAVEGATEKLDRAMRYASLGGGKRLRALLAVASADLFGVPRERSLRVAAAIEMLHGYSLVHDDLPCMDDDDLRRGKPTVHRAFDEASAVLAGDGLQAQAFLVLADPATHADAGVQAALVAGLALAAGPRGMVGGQAIDLAAVARCEAGLPLGYEEIADLQARKTGALICFSAEAGAILGQAKPAERAVLRDYAAELGLAFQIADDLLDHEGSAAEVGKAVGKDAAAGKATFVGLLGLEPARAKARALTNSAKNRLASQFGPRSMVLQELAEFVITRRS